jgi:hypothetical protein
MFSTVYASTSRWITALLGAFLNPAGTGSSSTTVHVRCTGGVWCVGSVTRLPKFAAGRWSPLHGFVKIIDREMMKTLGSHVTRRLDTAKSLVWAARR